MNKLIIIMNNLINMIFGKKNPYKIVKSEDSEKWLVMKKFKIMYMGTKEMCETFVKNQMKIHGSGSLAH